MAYEIDYIPVGNGESSGDAITLRFGNLNGLRQEQTVIVIDGGFQESGEKIVEHIKNYYHTDYVDLVIATHLDRDHISGLFPVLENLKVGYLLMHRPWEHNTEEIRKLFFNKRLTATGLGEKLEKSLEQAVELEELAIKAGVPIMEPFQGVTGYGTMHILGPSREYYESLIPLLKGTPNPIPLLQQLLGTSSVVIEKVAEWLEDNFNIDLLNDDEERTSAENSTSAIILFNVEGHKLLFTGDAGKTALHGAADYANSQGILLTDLNFLDVPHHGSKNNISSKVLNRILAPTAFVSASKESTDHPSKKVTNALTKRGTKVYVNRSGTLRHHHGAPPRSGWTAATQEPFHSKVES